MAGGPCRSSNAVIFECHHCLDGRQTGSRALRRLPRPGAVGVFKGGGRKGARQPGQPSPCRTRDGLLVMDQEFSGTEKWCCFRLNARWQNRASFSPFEVHAIVLNS